MAEQSRHTIDYFQAPKDYFWRWADDGTVLEFANGRTICYREDLTFILGSLTIPANVQLGTIILVLCACKDNPIALFDLESVLRSLAYRSSLLPDEHEAAKPLISEVLRFLGTINELPADLRSGLKRVALLQAVLETESGLDGQQLRRTVNEFKSGALDEVIFAEQPHPWAYGILKADLVHLAAALRRFPDAAVLELKLRTGITQVPDPAPIELPAAVPEELIEQLAGDLQTAGLARLAKKIIAALNIPMHLSGSSDQSLGGVSDISNRGHYDKLLLSELAQDDLLLTARLANNEALFLQREKMPADQHQQWHLMIDHTIKMWGMPRLFALSAALAFHQSRKQQQMDAWALGGQTATPVDLGSKAGIIDALEKLEPQLHAGAGLKKLLSERAATADKYLLITGDYARLDAAFMRFFGQVKEQIDYLIELNRSGHIALYETRGKKFKLVNRALIDLEETVFSRVSTQRNKYHTAGLPAMLGASDYPLLFPASKIRIQHHNSFKWATDQVLVITQDRRLLYWRDKAYGAAELIENTGSGDGHHFGQAGGYVYLLIRNYTAAEVRIHQLHLDRQEVLTLALHDLQANYVCFADGVFHLVTGSGSVTAIDPQTGKQQASPFSQAEIKNRVVTPHLQVLSQIKKIINNGYSVINSAKSIDVRTNGKLFIDQRELHLDLHGRHLSWKEHTSRAGEWIKPARHEQMEVAHLPNLKFTKFIWADGSEAVLDSRGLLHLKSADTQVPECTIILVLEKTAACWSADGKLTGNPYFIGASQAAVMLAADFYDRYIAPFIQRLR